MRFLFVSYSFPGALGPMAQWLARDAASQVIFATSRFRQELPLPGVHRVMLRRPPRNRAAGGYLDQWEQAMATARSAAASLETVRDSGFAPDIIFNASSNGAFLACLQVYPECFSVNFLEPAPESRPTCKRDLEALQILSASLNFAFAPQDAAAWNGLLRQELLAAPRLVDGEFFCPDKSGRGDQPRLAVFCAGAEEGCLQACRQLLAGRPRLRVSLVAANSFSYRRLQALCPACPANMAIQPWPRMDALRDLLREASLCLFVEGRPDFLPAAACGAPVIFAGEAGELPAFVRKSGARSPQELAGELAQALDRPRELAGLGEEARARALAAHASSALMPAFFGQIRAAWQRWRERTALDAR